MSKQAPKPHPTKPTSTKIIANATNINSFNSY
jgi:hypothetical protein